MRFEELVFIDAIAINFTPLSLVTTKPALPDQMCCPCRIVLVHNKKLESNDGWWISRIIESIDCALLLSIILMVDLDDIVRWGLLHF